MEYKLLEKEDLELMIDFVDDECTKYKIEDLTNFINNESNLGFIAKDNNKIVGFSFGYILTHPDGESVFYFDAIDVMKDYQGKGIGTELMTYTKNFVEKIGCSEMFLVTNRSNISACKCYEKAGGISESKDDVVYVYDFGDDK